MSLSSGTRLGPYEILAPLGAGGMGEVYRASDARLGREVAIKVLPATVSMDPDRLRRFEQEARAAAALNHPNLLAVYDIGTHEGAPYIVSELLDGETLRAKLAGLSVRRALDYAIQISHGLAAAHDKGIVHRDLKPENIFVTTDGRVKILDFGLAKLTQADAALSSAGDDATRAMETTPGVLLGTMGYMAPEQARGQSVDHRADTFAFGAVLYEMLAGQRAFPGATPADTISAILEKEPAGLPVSGRKIPPALARIASRCLEKDAGARFQSTRDLSFALEASDESSSSTVSAADMAAGTPPAPKAGRGSWRERMLWGAALVVTAAVAAAVTWRLQEPAPAAEIRLDVANPATSDPLSLAISPDGRQIVFSARSNNQSMLWVRSLASTVARPIPGTESGTAPFWSPDGRSVGFFAVGKLRRADLAGNTVQSIVDVGPARGGTWNASNVIVYAPSSGSGLYRVPASGGAAEVATVLSPGMSSHRYPQFLPDGTHFIFYGVGPPGLSGIYLGSLGRPDVKRLGDAEAAARFLAPHWVLVIRQGVLSARQLDLKNGTLDDTAIPLAERVSYDASTYFAALDASASGAILYRPGGGSRRQLIWFDRSGKAVGTLGEPDDSLLSPALAPDGKRVAVLRTLQGNTDIWTIDAARTTRLTFDPALDQFPTWSPDGKLIVFRSNRQGAFDMWIKASTGAGNDQLLMKGTSLSGTSSIGSPYDWSRDGRFILYSIVDPKTSFDVWALPMNGATPGKPFPLLNSSYEERNPYFSPDGRWMAYSSTESGRAEIHIRPFPGPGGQWQVSTGGGIQPRWSVNGKELYFVSPDGKLMAASIVVSGSSLEPGLPVPVFQANMVGGGSDSYSREQYDVAADGRFLVNTLLDDAAVQPMTLVLNWERLSARK